MGFECRVSYIAHSFLARTFWPVRVFCVRVFRVRMIMVVVMMVAVIMPMFMMMMVIIHIQTAFTGAKIIALPTGIYRHARCIGTLALNVVVMAFLYGPNFGLKTQNLGAVFAGATGGWRHFAQLFSDAFGKGSQNLGVIV